MANLLIVDENPDSAMCQRVFLERDGHEVRVARDAREAMDLLGQHLPDLISLVIEMASLRSPDLDYGAFLHEAGRKEVPILLTSWGIGVESVEEIARVVGTRYVLSRPFDLRDLFALVREALTQRTPPSPCL